MAQKSPDCNGFTAVEGFLIVLLIAVIGFGSWLIWPHDHKSKPVVGHRSSTTISTHSASAQLTTKATVTTYQAAPSDLQKAIMAYAQEKYPACINEAGTGFVTYVHEVNNPAVSYVPSRAALADAVCGEGPQQIYVYGNGQWSFASGSVDGFTCSTLERYKIPSVLLGDNPQCFASGNTETAYTQN